MSSRKQSVQNMQPRVLQADDPHALFAMGEYSVCLHMLGRDGDVALRIRCLTRLGRFAEAVRIDMLETVESLTGFPRFEAITAMAAAFHAAGIRKAADEFFEIAYALADTLALNERARADLHHADAKRHWSRQHYEAAERLLDRLRGIPGYRARELEMRAWIAAGRGDLDAQTRFFAESLHVRDGDPWFRATALRSYADLVAELHSSADLDVVAGYVETFDWSTDMSHHRFVAYRALAIGALLSGRTFKMAEYLCKAERSAHSPAQRCELAATKAWLAASDGDDQSAADYRALATQLSEQVQWANESDYRVALLILAREHLDAGEVFLARRAWDIYRAIQTPISPILAHGLYDRRLYAMERAVEGLLFKGTGERQEARTCLVEAFEIFREVGYRWRAIRVAMGLAEISGKPGLLDYAAIEAERYFPRSRAFGPALETHRKRMRSLAFTELSPTRRAIIAGILDGKTEKAIAESIGISPNTVRNRIGRLYDKYTPQKRNRTALIECLRKLGMG